MAGDNQTDIKAIFQFHKGTIKTSVRGLNRCRICNFNSIKVRLKHNSSAINVAYVGFQFHKGTIKTDNSCLTRTFHRNFNSIKVRLKPIVCSNRAAMVLNFNSIKVRLKQSTDQSLSVHIINFNSIKVRLKHYFQL